MAQGDFGERIYQMKILITGGTGFIGSHLLEEFKGSPHQILALGRSQKNLIEGIQYDWVDLTKVDNVKRIIETYQPEVIYHLAACSAESTGEHSPINMTTSGYNTFFNVITPAIDTGKLKKFIYVSSAAVYGNIPTPYSEDQTPEPNDIYAVTKYANELSLKILAQTYGFEYVIIRPHNVTGERQDPTDPTRNVVPMFMQLLRLGKKPKIFGDGSSVRCFTYVKDVAVALYRCLEISDTTINVGSDKPTSLKELYEKIVEVSGIQVEPDYLPPRGRDVKENTVNHVRSRFLIDYPETSFDITIRKTWEWVNQQPLQDFIVKKKEINA